MMELKEGMYIRTKQGYIAKFKKYDEIFNILRFETPIFLRSWIPCDYMQKDRFMNRYFSKASNNIIDLIEVGDYVNGSLVDQIDNYSNGYICVNVDRNNEMGFREISFKNEDIKSIVTKEMFSNAEYRVETD